MRERKHRHLFPIIDEVVSSTVTQIQKDGDKVRCGKGCDHCCYLLVEVSWEEAVEVAYAVAAKPARTRRQIIERLREHTREARELFLSSKGAEHFARPTRLEKKLPDSIFDKYFYKRSLPCPFLENHACGVYESRPTPCRLHFVTSSPELCRRDVVDDSDYEVPDLAEEMKENVGPIIAALEKDGRWGHLGILVEAALEELHKKGEIRVPELEQVRRLRTRRSQVKNRAKTTPPKKVARKRGETRAAANL